MRQLFRYDEEISYFMNPTILYNLMNLTAY